MAILKSDKTSGTRHASEAGSSPRQEQCAHRDLRLIDIIDQLSSGKEVFFRYVNTVADVMTTDAKYLSSNHRIADAVAFFDEHRVRHIPILDAVDARSQQKELVGIVSQRDIALALSTSVGTLTQSELDDTVLAHSLDLVITRNPLTTQPDAPIFEAVGIMVEEKIDCLPVITGPEDQQELIGILTSTDIIKCFQRLSILRRAREEEVTTSRLVDFARGQDSSTPTELLVEALMGTAADVMSRNVTDVSASDTLSHAIGLMLAHKIRHLLVVDKDGQLKGILTDRDILRHVPSSRRGPRSLDRHESRTRQELSKVDIKDEDIRKALSMKVTSAMTANPVTVTELTPMPDVAEILCDHRVCAVPVLASDSKGVIGILTHTDFLKGILALSKLATASTNVRSD